MSSRSGRIWIASAIDWRHILAGSSVPVATQFAIAQEHSARRLAQGNLTTNARGTLRIADAPTDGTSIELLVKASEIGVTTGSPRFVYTASAFNNLDGSSESLRGSAALNAFTPALPFPATTTVAPDGSALIPPDPINLAEWNATPSPLGIMAVTMDNSCTPSLRLSATEQFCDTARWMSTEISYSVSANAAASKYSSAVHFHTASPRVVARCTAAI